MQEPETLAQRTVFPGSAISAEVGVVPVGETAVTHFYVIGTVTGRRGNELSMFKEIDVCMIGVSHPANCPLEYARRPSSARCDQYFKTLVRYADTRELVCSH